MVNSLSGLSGTCYSTNINTRDIKILEHAQRDVDAPKRQRQFKDMLKNFDARKFDPIKVCLINGKYHCFDGQMRIKVAKERNKGRDLVLPCLVYPDITTEREAAEMYLNQGTNSPITLADKIPVDQYYGFSEDVADVTSVLEKYGLELGANSTKANNRIHAIKVVFDEYKHFGNRDDFEEYIRILKNAWDGEQDSLKQPILKGLGLFCRTYKGEYKEKMLVSKLRMVDPRKIMRAEDSSGLKGASKYAAQIYNAYNARSKGPNRLPFKF